MPLRQFFCFMLGLSGGAWLASVFQQWWIVLIGATAGCVLALLWEWFVEIWR